MIALILAIYIVQAFADKFSSPVTKEARNPLFHRFDHIPFIIVLCNNIHTEASKARDVLHIPAVTWGEMTAQWQQHTEEKPHFGQLSDSAELPRRALFHNEVVNAGRLSYTDNSAQ